MTDIGRNDLLQLAQAAGLQLKWRDAHGVERVAEPDSLRAVLQALEIPCGSAAQCRDSLEQLKAEADPRQAAAPVAGRKNLCIMRAGASLVLQRQGSPHYRLQQEDGSCIMGTARDLGGGFVAISGIQRPGYHRLDMGGVHCTVAVVPKRSPSVSSLLARAGVDPHRSGAPRPWVLNAQLYGLCREPETDAAPNPESRERLSGPGVGVLPGWEVGGDFSLLGQLARQAAEHGAVGLAISPVHAMFSADLEHYSPYSPSSRLFLNAVYADPCAVLGEDLLRALRNEPEQARLDARHCMDWPAIQGLRLKQLRRLFETFDELGPTGLLHDFEAFRSEGGEALGSHAGYETLHAHFASTLGPGHGWQDWPSEYQDPRSDAVRRHMAEHAAEPRFHIFLQWLAARSLARAHETARSCMPLGLIADMAVGTDPRGSHAWSRQEQIMKALSVGAPPDVFQPQGQNWGLTAFSPRALQQQGYEGYIETLRAALAYAGGIRVDHVMGLARMWMIPDGAEASDGVYLGYPRADMLDLLVLESWRHGAVTVGENLGTVPEDFNDALHERGMLGMSVLWFEQDDTEPPTFKAPQEWPQPSMAMISTHDLPTLRGWWSGRDIDWRARQGEIDGEQSAARRETREQQKTALWHALQNADLAASDAPVPLEAPDAEILAFVAGTPAALMSVALEDLLGHAEQPNLPGDGGRAEAQDRHPNWRRSYPMPVEQLLQTGEAPRLLKVLQCRRPGDPS